MKNIYQFIRENKTYSILGAILMVQGIFYTFTDNDLMATLTLVFFACVITLYNVEKIRESINDTKETLKLLNAKELIAHTSVDINLLKRVLTKEIKQVENKIRQDLIEQDLIAKTKKSKK